MLKKLPWLLLAGVFLFALFKIAAYEGLAAGCIMIFLFGPLI